MPRSGPDPNPKGARVRVRLLEARRGKERRGEDRRGEEEIFNFIFPEWTIEKR